MSTRPDLDRENQTSFSSLGSRWVLYHAGHPENDGADAYALGRIRQGATL
jgi:ribonuclease HI